MTDSILLKGGCACGAVSYRSSAAPQFSFHCQCRKCQRITGTGHSSQFIVPRQAVTFEGQLRYFEQVMEDGNTASAGFCPNCGSPILTKTSGYPDILFFHAGSLEDPAQFKPEKVVWANRAQAWDYMDPKLIREPGNED